MRIYNERPLSERSESSEMSFSNNKISSSSSSASSSVNFPALCRKVSSPTLNGNKKVGISMHKFINSKGKTATKDNSYFSPFVSLNGNGLLNNSSNDYYELKPPQFVKSNLTTLRRRVSAICKIQEELKEMKAREDELRYQRIRVIGLSQPNLSTLTDESDDQIKDNVSQSEELVIIRTNSNPNLIDTENSLEDNTINDKDLQVGGPRRKIPLIALWEEKIQQEIQIKN